MLVLFAYGDSGAAQAGGPDARTLRVGVEIHTIDVDGVPMRVRTASLDTRKPGQPAIVFESGGSAPLETWDRVWSAVAKFSPVVAYDRAGTGQSGWDSLPPTPERIGRRLQRVLEQLNVPPPYILVGHSWGGALIRYYGGLFPSSIAGIVYLDPTDLTMEPAEEVALLESIGGSAADRDAFYTMMERALAKTPPAMRAEGEVTLSIFRQDVAGRKLPPPLDVPTTVILAGRTASLPQAAVKFDTKQYAQLTQQRRVERLRGWVRGGGEFHVATAAGHNVHVDDPDLVIEAIRRAAQAR